MKKIIIMSCLSFVTAFSSIAQDNSRGIERANRISDQMIRDLRLNNYQASRIRALNLEKVNQMMDIERKYAGNSELIDKNCKGVCKQRDKEVENFLSSDQYGQYFASRNQYYELDRNFAGKIGLKNKVTLRDNIASLPVGEKVSPAEAKPAPVIKPAESK